MTDEAPKKGVHKRWLMQEAAKVVFRWGALILAGLLALAFKPIGDRAQAIWNSPARLESLSIDVRNLTSAVERANGDDRIIRQSPGLSYVEEPVTIGEDVTLILVLKRTALGSTCRFIQGQSLFRDTNGITLAGSTVRAQRQIGDEATRLRIDLTPPSDLDPGRIELKLTLEYQCDGQTHFEPTETVTYKLLDNS